MSRDALGLASYRLHQQLRQPSRTTDFAVGAAGSTSPSAIYTAFAQSGAGTVEGDFVAPQAPRWRVTLSPRLGGTLGSGGFGPCPPTPPRWVEGAFGAPPRGCPRTLSRDALGLVQCPGGILLQNGPGFSSLCGGSFAIVLSLRFLFIIYIMVCWMVRSCSSPCPASCAPSQARWL